MTVKRYFINPNDTNVYADAVLVNDSTLYLSGLCSENLETGEVFYGDAAFETKNILNNAKQLLEKHGFSMDDVVQVGIYLTNMSDRKIMNEEYIKHFAQDKMPARFCVGNVALADEFKVEMVITAQK